MNMNSTRVQRSQRGATLITALVMLVVLTLLVISAINSSTTNLRIAGNMQIQTEATASAQQAIEQVISSNFTANPASATIPISVTGGATPDYTAAVAQPVCNGSRAYLNSDPNLPQGCQTKASLSGNLIQYAPGSGVQSGTSNCLAQQWEVQATVTDGRTGTSTEVHQGVSLNVPIGTSC